MTAILAIVPAYKNQLTGTTLLTTHALAAALREKGIQWGITSISNPDIEWVRNWFITLFHDRLKQYTHCLFIDDDMGFMPEVVLDMVAFGEPMVGALYPKKTPNREWAVSGIPNPEFRGPYIECEGIGCGCFLVRRDAVATMVEKLPHLIDTRPNTIDSDLFRDNGITRMLRFFDKISDPARGVVSEDISFGRRWRECGGKVWAAMHHKMVHVGPFEWSDTYATWAEAAKVKQAEEANARIAEAPILKENPILKGIQAKHGIVIYNPNDTFIGRSIEAYGEWAEFEIEFLAGFVPDQATVFDVGANIGTHTLAFSKMVGKHGKVFAFEAQPRLEKILEANIRLNNLGNVIWDCKAIGELEGTAIVPHMADDTEEVNFGNYSLRDPGPGTPTEITTIDSFAAKGADAPSPSLIKIDVEGMEAEVILGAMDCIARCRPVIYLDFGENERDDIADALEMIGYVGFWHMGPFFNPSNAFRNYKNIWTAQRVLAANLVCVKREDWLDNIYQKQLAGMTQYHRGDTWQLAMERMAAEHQRQAAE